MIIMFSLKLIWFSNFISNFFIIQLLLSFSNAGNPAVHVSYNYGCECDKFEPNFEPGVNYPCSNNIRITKITNNPLKAGEEPFYDEDTDSVYFVDEDSSTVYRYCLQTGLYYYARVGNETVCVIIPLEGIPDQFLITYGDNLAILTWNGISTTVSFRKIGKPDPRHPWPQYFINDAKIARNGALFFYTEPVVVTDITAIPRHQSTLFSILDGNQKDLITYLDFGNGLGYSYDGNWFYHSDSVQNLTWKSLYNQKTNSIVSTTVLLNYASLRIPGNPDSLTVDAQGFVWIACNGGSKIVKVNPYNGRVLCSLQLPAKTVTNLAFGKCPKSRSGKLDCIYVTSFNAFYLVEGVGSTGVKPDKLRLKTVFDRYGGYC